MQFDKISSERILNLQEKGMLQLSDVDKITLLKSIGWGSKRISNELGLSRGTVRKYIRLGKWTLPLQRNSRKLKGLETWLKTCFEKHYGNADVVRQELEKTHGICVSLRTVERAVKKYRSEIDVKAKATIRFETSPGKQLQIDFGSTKISIGGERTKVFLFIATLGFSRRVFVIPLLHERQSAWFKGIEESFLHFKGIPEQLLLDNAKSLVSSNNPEAGEVIFNERFKAFAQYWGFIPRACAPYRARTKGKDERMVGYVKRNAIAGHEFHHWEDLKLHLQNWSAKEADARIHGTTGEKPTERFVREEAKALRPLQSKPSFIQFREYTRKVHNDACVEVDCNHYSVPHHFIGKRVFVRVVDKMVKILYESIEIACHMEYEGKRHRIIIGDHIKDIVGAFPQLKRKRSDLNSLIIPKESEFLRPLSEYAELAGGNW